MFALLRKNLFVLRFLKAIALFFGCLFFSVSSRVSFVLSFEQHMVSAVSNHYYLSYFLLPMVLFNSFSFLEDDEPAAILRYRSYFNYFSKKWMGASFLALIALGIQTAAILISGLTLPLTNNWQIAESAYEHELFSVLQDIFSSPLSAFITYSVFQWFGIAFIFGFAMWLGHYFGKRGTIFVLIGFYLYSILWIKISALQKLPLSGFNHLLILHHNFVGGRNRTIITGITLTFALAWILLSVKRNWRISRPAIKIRLSGISGYYLRHLSTKRNITVLTIVAIFMMLYKWLGGGRFLQSGGDWITVLFAGHGIGHLHPLLFLELLITAGTPMYLLALFVEKVVGEQSIFVTVRTEGRRQVIKGVLLSGALFIAFYALLWVGVGILGIVFSDWELSPSVIRLLFYAVTMRFLDIFLQFSIVFVLYILIKQITVGFLVVFALHFLCALPHFLSACLPLGLSCLSRISPINEMGLSSSVALTELAVLNMAGIVILVNIGYKKILKED